VFKLTRVDSFDSIFKNRVNSRLFSICILYFVCMYNLTGSRKNSIIDHSEMLISLDIWE
jgi:hypothetical protein